MSKKKKHLNKEDGIGYLDRITYLLQDKYKNIWMNKYQFEGDEIDWRKNRYILKQYYTKGFVGACKSPVDTLEFAPFTIFGWDNYDTPTQVQLINKRNSALIPEGLLRVQENVVISYIQPTYNSIADHVDFYIDRIALTELIIRTNLHIHNMPFLLGLTATDKEKITEIMNEILDGNLMVAADFNDIERIKVFMTGAPYIIDKLYKYKKDMENELNTYLGVNNTGVEKQERLLVDEVNANNQEIQSNSDSFLSQMEDFCTRVHDVLGFDISVKALSNPDFYQPDFKQDKEGEQNDNNK